MNQYRQDNIQRHASLSLSLSSSRVHSFIVTIHDLLVAQLIKPEEVVGCMTMGPRIQTPQNIIKLHLSPYQSIYPHT